MPLDWNDIRFYLAVARHGNIAKAAEELKVNQSTVMRRIDAMEDRLHLTLFLRNRGDYQLTAAGKLILAPAEKMDEQALELARCLTGHDDTDGGDVVLTAPSFMIRHLLSPALQDFFTAHPDINLTLHATNSFLDLQRNDADVAVRLTNDPEKHLPPNLIGRKLGDIELCAYQDTATDTDKASWIGWDESVDFKDWLVQNNYPDRPVQMVSDDILGQAQALHAAPLMAVLPCLLGDSEQGLQRVKNCKVFQGFEVWVLTHPDLKGTKRIGAVMSFVADTIRL